MCSLLCLVYVTLHHVFNFIFLYCQLTVHCIDVLYCIMYYIMQLFSNNLLRLWGSYQKKSFLFTKKKFTSPYHETQLQNCSQPKASMSKSSKYHSSTVLSYQKAQPKHNIPDVSNDGTTLCRHTVERITKMRRILPPALMELTV